MKFSNNQRMLTVRQIEHFEVIPTVFQLGIGTTVLQLNRLRGWVVTEWQSRDYSNPEFLLFIKFIPVTCVHKN